MTLLIVTLLSCDNDVIVIAVTLNKTFPQSSNSSQSATLVQSFPNLVILVRVDEKDWLLHSVTCLSFFRLLESHDAFLKTQVQEKQRSESTKRASRILAAKGRRIRKVAEQFVFFVNSGCINVVAQVIFLVQNIYQKFRIILFALFDHGIQNII